MVYDEALDAIELMIEICGDRVQADGMIAVRNMLMDFPDGTWSLKDEAECCQWLEQYLLCNRKDETKE